PHLGAGDETEGVVELDPVGVRVVGAGGGHQRGGAGEQKEQGCEGDPPHGYGPVGTCEGSQPRVPLSVNGVEPSPGLRSFAPGQRCSWFVRNPSASAWAGGSGVPKMLGTPPTTVKK